MTVKEYLRQYLTAYNEAQRIGSDIARLRIRYAYPSAIQYSDMPKAHNTEHDLSDYAAKVQLLEQDLNRKMNECIRVEVEIRQSIDQLPDDRERELLRLRYIDGMTWEAIAVVMGYALRHVHRIHGNALHNMSLYVTIPK